MNATYRYIPGAENVCRRCLGFIRWPDGVRRKCVCETSQPYQVYPKHAYWQQVPFRTREQELNEAGGWRDGAMAG